MIGPVLSPLGKMAQNEERWRGYLQRMRARDRQSFAQFYDETSGVVYGLALRILNDPPSAADVVVEVYQHFWSSPTPSDALTSVLASLTTTTRNLALRRLRKAERRTQLPAPVPIALPPVESVLGHERDLVTRALALLDPAQREAIELAFFCGMTDLELATALAVSPQAIRTRISTGMRKLNEALRLVSSTEGNA
jgi:RNA polymerase sigma-70 factor (ECF subfamily)